jgi:hypothetical protein
MHIEDVMFFVVGIAFFVAGTKALRRRVVPWMGGTGGYRRDSNPNSFWSMVIFVFGMGSASLTVGIFRMIH